MSGEKSDPNREFWTPSGIFRDDNSWLYIQGNYQVLFIFAKNWLRRYFLTKRPETPESYGTVRKFYLPMKIAREWAAKVIDVAQAKSEEETA